MDQSIVKRILPHILAYLIMMAVSFIFFSPYVFQGKVLTQGDNVRSMGLQTEVIKYAKEDGKLPYWTNSIFGGMPAYQIQAESGGNVTRHLYSSMFWFKSVTNPHIVVLVAMVCAYLLLIVLGVDWRISIIGAIGFGLSNYQIDLAEAGHSTKMAALALVPGMFAGALLAYKGRYWLGGAMFGLFVSMEILANHIQITFYAGLMLILLGIIQLFFALKKNTFPHFMKASMILVVAGLLGVSANLARLWSTQEYAEETIRGKSELSTKAGKEGLDKDYIFGWSYGIMESMTLMVPNFNGGGASQHFRGTELHDRLYRQVYRGGGDAAVKNAERQIAALLYWGNQPFVGVAIYFGAVILLLFFLGAFLIKGEVKVWLVAAGLFTLSLAWGGNFFLNGLLVDYVPLFNKFRAVSMALGLTNLAVVVLAALGLQGFLSDEYSNEEKQRALYVAGGISLALCLFAVVASFTMDFAVARDARYNLPQQLLTVIHSTRASIMRMDALRSILFIALSFGCLWAYLKGKLKVLVAVGLVGLLSVLDVWSVNKRILFSEKYETPRQVKAQVEPNAADKQIMQDKDPHFRVLDLSRGAPFTSANASYFHKSIGGYHAAKLMNIQDVSERYLGVQHGQNPLEHLNILGMLNTKYVIQQDQQRGAVAQQLPPNEVCGNAWFVDNYTFVDNADQDLNALASLQPKQTAVIRKQYAPYLEGLANTPNPNDNIKLTAYHPDRLTYEYQAASDRLTVFSEMYYPPSKGWNMYLDGQLIEPFIKADYLLRAARLPAGKHTLEMRFEPSSFILGSKIGMAASILLLVGFVAMLFLYFRENELPNVDRLDEFATGIPVEHKAVSSIGSMVDKGKKKKK